MRYTAFGTNVRGLQKTLTANNVALWPGWKTASPRFLLQKSLRDSSIRFCNAAKKIIFYDHDTFKFSEMVFTDEHATCKAVVGL